jgi:hypothetical protein
VPQSRYNRRMAVFLQWLKAVGLHWKRELLGGFLIGLLALISEISGATIPPGIYEGAAVVVLFYAMFLAWRDEHEIIEKAALKTGAVERNWRPLNEGEKDALATRLRKLRKCNVSLGYSDKTDCSDLAEDFTEVFRRAGWYQPAGAAVTYDSIGARDVVVMGKKSDQLASIVVRAISESTYIKPVLDDTLEEHAFVSIGVLEGKEVKHPIDLRVRIGQVKRN